MVDVNGIIDQGVIDQAVLDTKVEGAANDGEFDPNLFLKILMAQLENQSPFDTTDTSEILEQQAILTEVEQAAKQSGFLEDIQGDLASNFAAINQTLVEIKDALNNQ